MADTKVDNACPGDCKKCSMFQHSYCAAQMARNTQDMLAALSNEVAALSKKLEEMFNGEIIAPPTPGDAPASDAQDEAVQTIDPDNV